MVQTADPQELARLLVQFQQVQTQRALCYSQFHAAFNAFMRSKDEVQYKQTMAGLTRSFNGCSQGVIAIEQELRDRLRRPDLAALLRRVQDHERSKLRLTLSLQSLKQAYATGTFSWQQQAEEEADMLQPDQRPAASHEVQAGLAAVSAHRCGCHGAGGPEHAHGRVPEPTQYEYEAAVSEAIQLLDADIVGINDVLDDIKELVAELSEQT